ncbi:MAG: hypothetical protein JO353_11980 [Phycisphaerae bacterium]|nr:hypothetical protein [Phycisphaerae bacterium]
MEGVPDPTTDPTSQSNFTHYKQNLGYSYANPYPSNAAANAGYQFTNKMNAGFALMADLNPGTGPGKNSRNHEGRGQNVLYADTHVAWQWGTKCGMNGDEIYNNQAGVVQGSPIGPSDSVLLPVD